MDPTVLAAGREALLVALTVSAPPLAAALLVGLVSGALQAATQIQDHALGAVPRLVAVLAAVGLAAPWMAARVVRFGQACLEAALRVARDRPASTCGPWPAAALDLGACSLRLLPVVALSPFLGGPLLPPAARAALALTLGAVARTALGAGFPAGRPFLAVAASELALGAVLGFVATLPVEAARGAGRLVDTLRGATLGELHVAPIRQRETAVGDLLAQWTVALAAWAGADRLLVVGAARHLPRPAGRRRARRDAPDRVARSRRPATCSRRPSAWARRPRRPCSAPTWRSPWRPGWRPARRSSTRRRRSARRWASRRWPSRRRPSAAAWWRWRPSPRGIVGRLTGGAP